MKYYLPLLLLSFMATSVSAEQLKNEDLHTQLVKTAIKFDVFNQQCRGVSLAKKTANVNRLYIRKYGITVNNYIKVYLSQDPRKAKVELKDEMLKTIAKKGGCQALRKQRARKSFKQQYRTLFKHAETSAWIPEITRKR